MPVSSYELTHRSLRSLIREGDYAEGAQFLTEREVSRRFEVSRVTANKAISRLVTEGILEIRRGAGTFVRSEVLDYDLRNLVSFTEKARAAGKKPTTQVLDFRKSTAAEWGADLNSGVKVNPDEPLFFLERLRLADDTPVIHERRWIVARHCPKLSQADVTGSLYSAWTDKHALLITGADEVIHATNLSTKQAALLDVLPQTAALLVLSIGFIEDDKMLWWEETLYRTDRYEFRSRMRGLETSHPAVGRLT